MGDMDRAAYYHDRMLRGKFEGDESDIKKISMTTLKKTHDFNLKSTGNRETKP
jgi:hypothetical protein